MSEQEQKAAPPCAMVVFGASGDLFQRLLLPSLFNLVTEGMLPDTFALLGFADMQWDQAGFRQHIANSLREFWGNDAPEGTVKWIQDRASYLQGDFSNADSFKSLQARLEELEQNWSTGGNRLFYLAVAPSFISPIVAQLSHLKMVSEDTQAWRRVIVEKPFGNDLESARKLNTELLTEIDEKQIYRIDHFAGKTAIENIAVIRFENAIFESFWNRTYVDNVQITAAETVGLEGRAGFYEKSGALRDMVPNHLSELLSVVAMDRPVSLDAEHVRSRQADVLAAVLVPGPHEVDEWAVRGQYGAGPDSQKQPAYKDEQGVAPGTTVETYAALCLMIGNERWEGVPFYLRTGKRLTTHLTEVVITLRNPPAPLFSTQAGDHPNRVIFRLEPDAAITISFVSKAPGLAAATEDAVFSYILPAGTLGKHAKGYERLLYDCMCETLQQRCHGGRRMEADRSVSQGLEHQAPRGVLSKLCLRFIRTGGRRCVAGETRALLACSGGKVNVLAIDIGGNVEKIETMKKGFKRGSNDNPLKGSAELWHQPRSRDRSPGK